MEQESPLTAVSPEERLAILEQQVQNLQAENERQAKEKERLEQFLKQKPTEIVREVEVTPPDYNELKLRARKQEKIIKKYEQMFALGGVSDLTILIDNFIDSAKSQLKKISMEIECTSYDKQQIQRIIKLCDFLDQSREELYSFIETAEQGKFINNADFRKVLMDIKLLTERLNNKQKLYKIPEEELPTMHQTLMQVISVLKPYTNRDEF